MENGIHNLNWVEQILRLKGEKEQSTKIFLSQEKSNEEDNNSQ